MTKETSTLGQLENLMNSHVATATRAPLHPARAAPKPVAEQPKTITPRPASIPSPRFSLRLLSVEHEKINTIIDNTRRETGERVTLSDVLRIALSRVSGSSHITVQELKALRSTDGRRRAQ